MTTQQPESMSLSTILHNLSSNMTLAASEVLRLHACIQELDKDAARYRWLRDECGIVEYKEAFGSIGPGMLPSGDKLDAAIDKAIHGSASNE